MEKQMLCVEKIQAFKDNLIFQLNGPVSPDECLIRECLPLAGPLPGSELSLSRPVPETAGGRGTGCRLALPRREGDRDRLCSRFELWRQGKKLPGVSFVSEIEPAEWDYPYPQGRSKKGLQVRFIDDAIKLGVQHAALNLNLGNVMAVAAGPDTVPFNWQGRVFHIRENAYAAFDHQVKTLSDAGIVVNLILLNSAHWGGEILDPLLGELILHPAYDREGLISAFNMQTADGYAFYQAFVAYTAARYMRPDQRYGRACGLIIGNEVNSGWVWGNAGECSDTAYVREYCAALRTAWLTARSFYSQARVYVSLDHFWNTTFQPAYPLRLYRGRRVLELLRDLGDQDGDFGWCVAYHPYCEDFNHPDFWNDRTAVFNFSTPRITFKNLEILPAFLEQPSFLYKGRIRPIIFSEQGFHSDETERSEMTGAAAYCLAYWKIEHQPAVESFILHAHIDNIHEFGLNLGLLRRDKASGEENLPAGPKPIYEAFRVIDGPDADSWYQRARRIVGETIWDEMIHPVLDTKDGKQPGDLDLS